MGIRRDARRTLHDFLVNALASGAFGIPWLRVRLLRLAGIRIGHGVHIHGRCWFGGTDISIGHRSWINYGVSFDNANRILIGEDCLVGPQVLFVTSSHNIGPTSRRGGDPTSERISVGDGSWIGARATILSGVSIGQGCVIAAGAVVVDDCLPNTLYGGVPARPLRNL